MNEELDSLRRKIEEVDQDIIKQLVERFEIAKRIGEIKSENGEDVEDKKREEELFAFYEEAAREFGLDAVFVKQLFNLIINESKRIQN